MCVERQYASIVNGSVCVLLGMRVGVLVLPQVLLRRSCTRGAGMPGASQMELARPKFKCDPLLPPAVASINSVCTHVHTVSANILI